MVDGNIMINYTCFFLLFLKQANAALAVWIFMTAGNCGAANSSSAALLGISLLRLGNLTLVRYLLCILKRFPSHINHLLQESDEA